MLVASVLRSFPALFSSVFTACLLAGCAPVGTYQDATEADAAKLRFVASTDNATVSYFDAEHCDGLTTGILNNLFLADSPRRVGMSVAPPEKARGYLEIKLTPEKDVYLHINTQSGYLVCGLGFNFKPQRGTEYEVAFSLTGNECSTLVQRLQRIDGKDVRTPLMVDSGGPPACSRNPISSKPPQLLPDTPERTALMDRIIDGSAMFIAQTDPKKQPEAKLSSEALDVLISERKAKLGFSMPDDYWALYRQNLIKFDEDNSTKMTQVLQRTSDEYRKFLRSVDDKKLKEWARVDDTSGKRGNAVPVEQEKSMIVFYFQASKAVTFETINKHVERMAKMDSQYDVCSRLDDCWKR
ncbi:hypothetical protein ACIOZM_04880 [Pseudomonas sp. NPDC087346]|uniref:hypothetical protein n=1 Tax=Pseudomonas sp. NPDC087346 TaxID=3364438 RepID=UPI00382A74BD